MTEPASDGSSVAAPEDNPVATAGAAAASEQFWPARVEPDAPVPMAPVTSSTLRQIAVGGVRLVWWFPGIVAALVAYAAVAIAVYHQPYPNLWGVVGAVVVAAAWYASPLRSAEARRRRRLLAQARPLALRRSGS